MIEDFHALIVFLCISLSTMFSCCAIQAASRIRSCGPQAARYTKCVANDNTASKPKIGRPSGFNEVIRDKILEMVAANKTDAEIAEVIGVHHRTLAKWRKADQAFGITIREMRIDADRLVEDSLFNRAMGYSHPEEKTTVITNPDGTETVKVERSIKHYPPDTMAMTFWLRNRHPDRWREKQDVEHTHKLDQGPQVQILLPSNSREVLTVASTTEDIPAQLSPEEGYEEEDTE